MAEGDLSPRNILDPLSHATLIADGADWTSDWNDVSAFDSITVAVKTDQPGYFQVQFSPDATNQDSILTRYYRTSGIEAPHRFTITRQYCRIAFYNDSGTDQTYSRLQTMQGDKSDLNASLDSTLSRDFDATCVRPTDFHTEAALGRRQGITTWNKFGYNEAIGTSEEVLASWGGTFQYLTSGETIDIVSTSTADDLVGTGAQRIVVYGVDENWDSVIEVVEMDGTTTVTTTSQWIGINRVSIFKAGTGLKNAGTINVTATTSGYQMAQMPTGESTTQQVIFYVPRNYQFLAEWLYFNALKQSGGGNPELTFKGYVYSDVSTAEYEVYRDALDTARDNRINLEPPMPFIVGEKSILWFTVQGSTGTSSARGRMSGELFADPDAS